MVIVSNGKKDGARPVKNVASSNALESDAFMQETCSQYEMHTCAILIGMRVLCIVLSSLKGPSYVMHNTMKAAPTVSSFVDIIWRGVFLCKPPFAARTCVMDNKWQRATGSEVLFL